MPAYVFKGKTRAGAATSGERTADSKDAVIAMLRREQILVTSVKEKGKEIALPKFGGGISHKDVAIFTRQFSVMIDAGLATRPVSRDSRHAARQSRVSRRCSCRCARMSKAARPWPTR